jgi:integrase
MPKIDDALVRRLEPPATGNRIVYDGDHKNAVRGFGARITAAGVRSFVLNYRHLGRERRLTIGQWPAWSATAAREHAGQLRFEVEKNGADPLAQREAERDAPTMRRLIERFEEDELPRLRPSTAAEYRHLCNKLLIPRLGALKVSAVTRDDVETLHRDVTNGTGQRRGKRKAGGAPYQANRAVALLRRLFNLAGRRGWRMDNPAKGIARNPEERRARYLSQAEIAKLTAALAKAEDRELANAVRLLLLTGARRAEVLNATWSQFDVKEGVWTKPSAHTKQRKEHRVPLSAPAQQLLEEMSRSAAGERLFRDGAIDDLQDFWTEIRAAAELADVRIHDLRHSYASILASAGLSLPIIGQLLGHTQAATTHRYAHLFDEPLREATERVAAFIATAGAPKAEPEKARRKRGLKAAA